MLGDEEGEQRYVYMYVDIFVYACSVHKQRYRHFTLVCLLHIQGNEHSHLDSFFHNTYRCHLN